MHVLCVGQPYNPGRTTWPEGANLRFTQSGPELLLMFRSPTDREVDAVHAGKAQFGWVDTDHIGILAYRFGDAVPWSDATYSPHREDPRDEPAGVPPGDGHLLLGIVLVDADTEIIHALRQLTWPPRFVAAVRRSVERMAGSPFSPTAADNAVNALFARYPNTADLVRARADVTCTGGTTDVGAAGPDA